MKRILIGLCCVFVAKSFEIPTDLVYTDMAGNILKDKVEVAPFSSLIILQK